MSNSTKVPYLVIPIAFAALCVAVVFVVAIQAGPGVLVLVVLCVAAVGVIVLWVSRGLTATGLSIADKRLAANAEQHRHVEAVIKLGCSPHNYAPVERQIAAPVPAQAVEVKPVDPRREHALRLLSATIDSDKYGPKALKIMTQKDAGQAGIIADDWSAAVSYLFLFGVATGNTGTIIKQDANGQARNVSRLMADVARDRQDNEASAVMALPEVGR